MDRKIKPAFLTILLTLFFILASCSQNRSPLPGSLYFIDGEGESAQVWRLEKDGKTLNQLTHVESGVDGFSVLAKGETLAINSKNKLYLVNPEDQSSRLISDGGVIDASHPPYNNMISSPMFSPDGGILAYGWNGVHLYDLATHLDYHILSNQPVQNGTAQDYAKGAYSPTAWSPDGSSLLVRMTYYEACLFSIVKPGSDAQPIQLQGDGGVGCMASWSKDGLSVLIANPYFNGAMTGFWRYDAITGEETFSLKGGSDGAGYLIGWPSQTKERGLIFFQMRYDDIPPPVNSQFKLVRDCEGCSTPIPITEANFQIAEALWAKDGSAVVILGNRDGTRQLSLLDLDTGTLQVLVDNAGHIRNLVWGLR